MYKTPAIPPLQNISDRPTRDALLALTEGWQVRNGMTGSKENRFITQGEFDLALKKLGVRTRDVSEEQTGARKSTQDSAAACPSGCDKLIGGTTVLGVKDATAFVIQSPTPKDGYATNTSLLFRRDDYAGTMRDAWRFALGRWNSDLLVYGANMADPTKDVPATSEGNFNFVDMVTGGGTAAILYPQSKGGGMRLFGRLSFDDTRINQILIQLRNFQKISWNKTGIINTYFNGDKAQWILEHTADKKDLFAIHVGSGDWYQNGVNQSARINDIEARLAAKGI